MTLTEMKSQQNAPSAKKRKICNNNNKNNNNNNAKPKNKKKYRNNWQFKSDSIFDAISKICDKLGKEDMFGMIPTIDCYSSDTICDKKITKRDDFLSSKYDDPSKWTNEVAWCNPPRVPQTIIQTFNAFEERKMRGYVSVPYYPHDHPKYRSQSWLFQAQNKKCKSYVNIKGKDETDIYSSPFPCPFHTVVLYFDFQ